MNEPIHLITQFANKTNERNGLWKGYEDAHNTDEKIDDKDYAGFAPIGVRPI